MLHQHNECNRSECILESCVEDINRVESDVNNQKSNGKLGTHNAFTSNPHNKCALCIEMHTEPTEEIIEEEVKIVNNNR